MDEEYGADQQQEQQGYDEQPEVQSEPSNLSDAFKALRQANNEPAEGSVQDAGEPDDEPGGGLGAAPETMGSEDDGGSQQHAGQGTGGVLGDGEPGGHADDQPEVDYASYGKSFVDQLGQQAVSNARAKFNELGIKRWSLTDLYQKDERNGTVMFRNPDDERNPFRSRIEAQQWCDSFNAQVDNEFKKMANNMRNELLEQYKPTMQMIQFAPTFNALDDDTKNVFNKIIEPYAVNVSGKTIGYKVDLVAAARQASAIVNGMRSRYQQTQQQAQQPAQQQQQQRQKPKGSGPATDMNTGFNGAQQDEPKTLEEAMRMLRKKGK